MSIETQEIHGFRVWSETGKHYLAPEDIVLKADGTLWSNGVLLDNSDGHLIIERCVGLKDKNERWLYAGDLVEIDKAAGAIVWQDGSFVWQWPFGEPLIYKLRNLPMVWVGTVHGESEGGND